MIQTKPVQDVTYEVVLFFAQSSSYQQSDIIVTVDGHEVFAESRKEFAPGPGIAAEYQSKRFEARAGAPPLSFSLTRPRSLTAGIP